LQNVTVLTTHFHVTGPVLGMNANAPLPNRLTLLMSRLPGQAELSNQISNSACDTAQPLEALDGNMDRLIASVRTLLDAMSSLLHSLMIVWDVHYQQRVGVECAFVSGGLFALQTNPKSRQKIYQHWAKEAFTLISLVSSPLLGSSTGHLPIVMDFYDSASVYDSDPNAIRIRDIELLTPVVIHGLVQTNFDYDPQMTGLRTMAKPEPFASTVVDKVRKCSTGPESLMTVPKYVVDELEFFRSPDFMYLADSALQLKSFLAGLLAAEKLGGNIQIDCLNPISTQQKLTFLITDLDDGLKVCLNIVDRGSGDVIADSETMPLIGNVLLPGQRPNQNKVLVVNVFHGPRHSPDQYASLPHRDYFAYNPILSTIDFDLIRLTFQQIPLPRLEVADDLMKVVSHSQRLRPVLEKLQLLAQICDDILPKRENMIALFTGLMHYQRKTISILTYSGQMDPFYTLVVGDEETKW